MSMSWTEFCAQPSPPLVDDALRAYRHYQRNKSNLAKAEQLLLPLVEALLEKHRQDGTGTDLQAREVTTELITASEPCQSRLPRLFLEWIDQEVIALFAKDKQLDAVDHQDARLYEAWKRWKQDPKGPFEPDLPLVRDYVWPRRWRVDGDELTTVVYTKLSLNADTIEGNFAGEFYSWLNTTIKNERTSLWRQQRRLDDPGIKALAVGLDTAFKKYKAELAKSFLTFLKVKNGELLLPLVEKLLEQSGCARLLGNDAITSLPKKVAPELTWEAFDTFHQKRIKENEKKAKKHTKEGSKP